MGHFRKYGVEDEPKQREAVFRVMYKLGLGATDEDLSSDLVGLPLGTLDGLLAEPYRDGNVRLVGVYATDSTIKRGQKVGICYGTVNAKFVRLDPPVSDLEPSVGSCFDVVPRRTTRYTLTAEDGEGHTATESILVEVR